VHLCDKTQIPGSSNVKRSGAKRLGAIDYGGLMPRGTTAPATVLDRLTIRCPRVSASKPTLGIPKNAEATREE